MNDNIDNATPEELVDRLIDRALTERLGDDVPPDLSERILARTEASQRQAPVAQSTARRPTLVHLLTMAVAATLLIGTVSVIMSPVLSSRQTARGLQHAGKEAAELRLTFDGAATDKRNNLDLDRFRAAGQKSASSNERSQTQLELEGPPAEPIVAGTPVLVEGVQREKRETWGAYHNRQTDSHADKSGYPMPRLEAAAGRSDSGRVLHGYALEGRKSDLSGRPGQPAQLPEQLGWPTASATRGTQTGRRFRIETEVGQQVDRYLIDFETDSPDGQGPGLAGDRYAHIADNPFVAATGEQAVSTFSIDVDTAAYANVRQFVMQGNRLPPPDAVRIEELVNYFHYSYPAPDAGTGRPTRP